MGPVPTGTSPGAPGRTPPEADTSLCGSPARQSGKSSRVRDLPMLTLCVRLLLAATAGLVVGSERELRAQAAGIRTHALVAVGAALFTVAGAYGFADVPHGPNVDPARIAAQVASGVGFLGAGAILRKGLGVRGLNTAATLWLAAALGVAAGAGAYAAAGLGTGVVLLVLIALRIVTPLLLRMAAPNTGISPIIGTLARPSRSETCGLMDI